MIIFWTLLAALALIGELVTGTFYLLALCAGFVVAGALALLDFDLAIQLVAAAITVLIGAGLIQRFKASLPPPEEFDGDLPYREGTIISGDGPRYRVRWRGSDWDASGPNDLTPGTAVRITARAGNSLSIDKP